MGARNINAVRREVRAGKARLVIDFRYRDASGVERRFRRDASVQAAAAARAEAEVLYTRALTTGTVEQKTAPTVAEFIEATFKPYFLPRYRPATRTRYLALLRQWVERELGGVRLDALDATRIRAFAVKVGAEGVQLKGPINLVRTILRAAHEAGAIAELPDFPRKLFKESRKLPDAPTAEEVAAMLQHATGWLRIAIALAAYAGLRMGEVRALEVQDVDFDRGRILVRRSLSDDELTTPKSGHDRNVPIVPELRAVLVEAVRAKLPRARIVLTRSGTTPARTQVLASLKNLLRRHALKERSFHALRHFFCSTLVRRGASVEAVRVLAGHSALAVTQRYVHATAADLETAIAKLAGN